MQAMCQIRPHPMSIRSAERNNPQHWRLEARAGPVSAPDKNRFERITTMRSTILIPLALGLLSGGASAQSVGAPAGRDPVTAPGGTQGVAGPRNVQRAIRQGDAVRAPRGVGIRVTRKRSR